MQNLHVATEIRNQLGTKALYMLGAQNLVGDHNSLFFKIRGSKTFTHIRIELTPADLYKVTFMKIRGLDIKEKEEFDGMYCDQLHELIEQQTGLYTSMGFIFK